MSEYTLTGFVPFGTPCNVPVVENVGMWRERRWDGKKGWLLSDLDNTPGYPSNPTLTTFHVDSESGFNQCDKYAVIIWEKCGCADM